MVIKMNKFEEEFYKIYNGLQSSVDFYQFRTLMIDYVMQIMSSFIRNEKYRFIVKDLDKSKRGYAKKDEFTNIFEIGINNDVVKNIFTGKKPFEIFTIFHEIIHIFDLYRINNNDFSEVFLKRVCIDNFIDETLTSSTNTFYWDNYKTTAIEAHADLLAANLTRQFFDKCNIQISNSDFKHLLFIEFFSLRSLHNLDRKIFNIFPDLNNNKLTIKNILELIKKEYPKQFLELTNIISEEELNNLDNFDCDDFEKILYDDNAILDLEDIILNPMFREYINKRVTHKPRL